MRNILLIDASRLNESSISLNLADIIRERVTRV